MKTVLLICITLGTASFAFAQTPPAETTNPSSASSPHQRKATSTPTKETPATSNPEPAAASSPHQQHVTEGADKTKAKNDKMINDCMAKEQSMNASLSKDAAKKTCMDRMKGQTHNESRND